MSRIPREWTIKFHERHGRYVTLTEGGTCARRNGDTYDHGVVFSNRKLSIGEIFQLRIDELESKWAGSLRFGITTKNPNCPQTRIVRAVTDLFTEDETEYWMLSGCRVHNGLQEKEYNFNMHNLGVSDCVGLQVTSEGNLKYYVNKVCKGVAMCGIPTKKPVFAVFDVYGRTKQVSWKYYGAERLEELCRLKILELVRKDKHRDGLPLPKRIIEFLRDGC